MTDMRNENANPFENREDDYESYVREYYADNPDIGCLLWRWTGRTGVLQSMGLQSQTLLSD